MKNILLCFLFCFSINYLAYSQCNINWNNLITDGSPYYYIQGVICTGEAREITPCAIFKIDGDTVKADSLGRFHYIYYLTYERTANHGTFKKEIIVTYKNQNIILKSKINKYWIKPRRKDSLLIRYETLYFPKH